MLVEGAAGRTWSDGADDIRGSFCFHSLWFASEETAGRFATETPGIAFGTTKEFPEVFWPAFQPAVAAIGDDQRKRARSISTPEGRRSPQSQWRAS